MMRETWRCTQALVFLFEILAVDEEPPERDPRFAAFLDLLAMPAQALTDLRARSDIDSGFCFGSVSTPKKNSIIPSRTN
jgi:hypothetical protein